eukprot:1398143-Amphidinium_carterae.2
MPGPAINIEVDRQDEGKFWHRSHVNHLEKCNPVKTPRIKLSSGRGIDRDEPKIGFTSSYTFQEWDSEMRLLGTRSNACSTEAVS